MSDRIEIKDDGYSVVIKPQGKGQVRLFVNDTDSTTQKTIAAIRQQQADIDKLRAERDRLALLQEEAIANEADANEELSELRAELAEIKEINSNSRRITTEHLAAISSLESALDSANAELAAIKAAPVVGYLLEWNGPNDVAQYEVTSEHPTDVVLYESIRELIARPSK